MGELDRRDLAHALLGDAQLAPNPTLNLAVGAPLGMGVVPVLAMLAGQVDWLWKRDAIVGEADAQLRGLLLESAAMVVATVAEVRAAYLEAASATEQAGYARRDAEVAARVLAAEESALAAGEAGRTAVNRARMNAAEASNRVMEAEVATTAAKTRLLEAIGRGDHHLRWRLAAGDIRQATSLARKMVCEWGMSSLGMISFAEGGEHVFLARDLSRPREYSEATAQQIDAEVKRIIDEAYARAQRKLDERRAAVEVLAKALLEYETLDASHVKEILEHGEIKNPPIVEAAPPPLPPPPTDSAHQPPESIKPEFPAGGLPSPAPA